MAAPAPASPPRPVTHLIFDMDGLLLDTERLYSVVFQEICGRYGKEYSWDIKSLVMGKTALEAAQIVIDVLQLPMSKEELVEESQAKLQGLFPTAQLMPAVQGALSWEGPAVVAPHCRPGLHAGGPAARRPAQPPFLSQRLVLSLQFAAGPPPCSREQPHAGTREGCPRDRSQALSPWGMGEVFLRPTPHPVGQLHTLPGPRGTRCLSRPVMGRVCACVLWAPGPWQTAPPRGPQCSSGGTPHFLWACLVFEDAPNGVEAALAAGMQVVMVPDERLSRDLTSKATLVLRSLQDLQPQLFGLPAYD
nr:pseudouridine-5'-phosphatase [Marmota flaviventris]